MADTPAELLTLFHEEADEYLEALTQGMLDLEVRADQENRADTLREVLRIAHSLKGAARTVNLYRIERVAHHLEAVFEAVNKGQLTLSADTADVLYDGLDLIRALLRGGDEADLQPMLVSAMERLEALSQGQAAAQAHEPLPEPAKGPRASMDDHEAEAATIRVSIHKLDDLMAQVSELLVSNIGLEQRLAEVKTLRGQHARLREALRRVRPAVARLARERPSQDGREDTGRGETDLQAMLEFVDLTRRHMRESAARLLALDQDMTHDRLRLRMITGELQNGVRHVRMLPFETIMGGFRRMVRDLSRQHDKEIVFNVIGEQVELDKRVLEAIKDPILHILRNAIDHGIEPAQERLSAGKEAAGYITLIVEQRGGEILVTIADDGHGIDPGNVRRVAVRAGRITWADAEAMGDDEALSLIFLPGLSTKSQVTTTSGRGIGMDVVRQNVEKLRGHVIVQSRPGLGTAFQLTVPISLTTMRCMLARVGHDTYAIPLSAIERIMDVATEDIHTVKGRQVVNLGRRPVTLVALADVLERPRRPVAPDQEQLALILRSGDKLVAFLIDDLLSEQELVVKNLGREMVRVRNVGGVALLGTGKVIVILNPSDLVKAAQASVRHGASAPAEVVETRPHARILVVDDSITTRTLEENILEAAGYEVLTAAEGREALDLLRRARCDLIIADVEMPRMDGLKLTEAIRRDKELKHLPLILVTSREQPSDRERGMLAGADAYIVKSEFDQDELLETIGQLL
jgi:two-component system chemotaxis sensor kinase CheA